MERGCLKQYADSQAIPGLAGKGFWDGLVMAARKRKEGMVERCQSFAISDFIQLQRPREVEKVP